MPWTLVVVFVRSEVGRYVLATVAIIGTVVLGAWLIFHHGETAERQRQAQQQAAQIEANRRAADAAQDRAAQDPNPQGTLQREWSR